MVKGEIEINIEEDDIEYEVKIQGLCSNHVCHRKRS